MSDNQRPHARARFSGSMAGMLHGSNNTDPRRFARDLYWRGWRVSSIARELGEKRTTVHSWKTRDKWDAASPVERVEAALEARPCTLIAKSDKDSGL